MYQCLTWHGNTEALIEIGIAIPFQIIYTHDMASVCARSASSAIF